MDSPKGAYGGGGFNTFSETNPFADTDTSARVNASPKRAATHLDSSEVHETSAYTATRSSAPWCTTAMKTASMILLISIFSLTMATLIAHYPHASTGIYVTFSCLGSLALLALVSKAMRGCCKPKITIQT